MRGAAERNGQQFADAVVDVMRDWAQTILKREPAEGPGPNLPARLDDGAMLEQMAARLERIEREALRAGRRGRWRR